MRRTRQIRALAWALWKPNRAGIVGLGLVAPLAAVLVGRLSPGVIESQLVQGGLPLLFLSGLVYLLVIFSYAEFSTRTLDTGFPGHALRLPVATSVLTAVPLLAGTVILVGYVWIWTGLDLVHLDPNLRLIALSVGIGLSWMQVLNWGMSRSPIAAGVILILVIGATILSVATLAAGPGGPGLISDGLAWACMLGLLCGGVILAHVAVRRARRGDPFIGTGRAWSMRWPGLVSLSGFSSGQVAQFRYEWRLFGWILPVTAAFIGMLALLVQLVDPDNLIEATAVILAIYVYVAGALGLELGKSHFRKDDYRMTGFWATRPLSDAALAAAKLKLVTATTATGTALLFVPLGCAWMLAGHFETIAASWHALVLNQGLLGAGFVALLAVFAVPWLAWIISANLMVACLSGHPLLSGRLMMYAGPVFLAVAWGVYRLSQTPAFARFLFEHATLVGLVPAAGLIGLAAFLLRRSGRSLPAALPPLAVAAALAALVLLPLGAFQLALPPQVRNVIAVILADGTLATLFPFIAAPIALSANRHRR